MPVPPRVPAAALTVFSGIAFGVLAMVGVVAAVVFPTMKGLDPTLPGYAGYSGPHWSLAAGVVAERVFTIGFAGAGVALACCVAAVVLLSVSRGAGRLPVGRLALLVIAAGVFLAHVGWLQPRMTEAAREYRAAAARGDEEGAEVAKSQFDAMHPNASRLIMGAALLSLALFIASAWSAGSGSGAVSRGGGGGA